MCCEVANTPRCIEADGNEAQPTHDRPGTEPGIQRVKVTQPVQERQDHGVRTYRRCERLDRTLEVVSFATQQHQIELRTQVCRQHRRRVGDRRIAEWAIDVQAVVAQLLRAARPYQKRHVATGGKESSSEVTANRTGSDNESTHCCCC